MSNRPPEEERFMKNTIQLVKAVHHGVEKLYNEGYQNVNPTLLAMGIVILSSDDINKHAFIKQFIEKSHEKCWDKIKDKDEEFFIKNIDNLFDLSENNINMIKSLYSTKDSQGRSIIAQSFKDDIWLLLGAMIKCAIQYVYKRQQKDVNTFKNVKINHHIKVWNVKI